MIRAAFIFFSFLFTLSSVWAAESETVDTGYVNAQLVSGHDVVAPGQSFYIALRTQLDPKWHTYWRNPGDSGEPVQITWSASESLTYGDIVWPLPDTIPTGPIINYGFEGTPYFPVEFKVADDASIGDILNVEADVYYLVCYDVCVPEDAKLNISLSVGEPVEHGRWRDMIARALGDAPKLGSIEAGVIKDGDKAVFNFANLPEGNYENAYFFPFEQGIIDHSAPETFYSAEAGQQMRTVAGFGWDKGLPKNASGVLRFEQDGKAVGIEVQIKPGTEAAIGAVSGLDAAKPSGPSSVAAIGLWTAIFGAFVGGLILNLMPCVFPVISIKALSVAKMAHEDRSKIRREGWIYTAGVVATFLALTIFLLVLKSGGESVGWGFQLQSPKVVAGLAILLFVIGLNLLGVFEIGTGLQGVGGGLAEKGGSMGTFFTGALAVIVATPCTAHFMAPAIGFALVQPAIVTLAVFMALAIGFAAPFLLLAYAPNLLAKLPKPGAWMVRFREFLAFPMFAAVIWLLWILTQQAGEKGLSLTLITLLAIGFALWLFKSPKKLFKGVAALALISGLALPFTLHNSEVALTHPNMEAWSNEKIKTLRADGQAVFVDFTAAWCVTCKANKKLVLDKPDVQDIFARTNTAFLVADWTNKNDVIAEELARHGRSGVPLYLYYPPGNNDVSPVILPQILSKSVIDEVLSQTN